MKWENLQTFTCPHCDNALLHGETAEAEITCSACSFHITPERFDNILEHRGRPGGDTYQRMKWQMLHNNRCPMCEGFLRESEHSKTVLQCYNPACHFRIRDDRMADILADQEHPANKFKNR